MALSADDKLAILELAAKYSHAVDAGNAEEWADTFTEEGVIKGAINLQGRVQLRAYILKVREASKGCRHWTGSHVVTGEGDAASHSSYWSVVRAQNGKITIIATGTYHDELIRIDGVWRFNTRVVTIDGLAGRTENWDKFLSVTP